MPSASVPPSAPSPIAHVVPVAVEPIATLPSMNGSPHHIARSETIGSVDVIDMPTAVDASRGSSKLTSIVRRDWPGTGYVLSNAVPSGS